MPNNNNNQIARHKWRTRSGTRAKKKTLFFVSRAVSACEIVSAGDFRYVVSPAHSLSFRLNCVPCFTVVVAVPFYYRSQVINTRLHIYSMLWSRFARMFHKNCVLYGLGTECTAYSLTFFVECIHFGGQSKRCWFMCHWCRCTMRWLLFIPMRSTVQ